MGKLFCRFCGKEITGQQISCFPDIGYMCYDCKHTRYTSWLLEKLKNTAEIRAEQDKTKARDEIALFLTRNGYKFDYNKDNVHFYVKEDDSGNRSCVWFIIENGKWIMLSQGDGIEVQYDCVHLAPYHLKGETEDTRLGFWYDVNDIKELKRRRGEADESEFGPDIRVL